MVWVFIKGCIPSHVNRPIKVVPFLFLINFTVRNYVYRALSIMHVVLRLNFLTHLVLVLINLKELVVGLSISKAWVRFISRTYPSPPSSSNSTMLISYVNGIYHTEDDWRRISGKIEAIFSTEVSPFYNPSTGWWVRDITNAGYSLALRPHDLYLSKQLAEHLKGVLKKVGEYGRVLHIAHSGGAILTYLAAKHHLSRTETNRIDVITFGAGKSITNKYFRGRVCNYYTRNDPLIFMDSRAIKLFQRSFLKSSLHSSSREGRLVEMRDKKHGTPFIFINPHSRNPLNDHSIEGEAYQLGLRIEADVFKETLIKIQSDILKFQSMRNKKCNALRHFRKVFAKVTGVHHFWQKVGYCIGCSIVSDEELTIPSNLEISRYNDILDNIAAMFLFRIYRYSEGMKGKEQPDMKDTIVSHTNNCILLETRPTKDFYETWQFF